MNSGYFLVIIVQLHVDIRKHHIAGTGFFMVHHSKTSCIQTIHIFHSVDHIRMIQQQIGFNNKCVNDEALQTG